MTRLVRAELLKLRRRWATFVVLGLVLGIMVLLYVLVGLLSNGRSNPGTQLVTRFPAAYQLINQFVFGLGSLLAVAYAAAIAGADWSWGVLGVVVARGESRSGYILAKAIGLGIVLLIGVLIAYAAGLALVYLSAALSGSTVNDPFGRDGALDLAHSLGYGSLVLLQRAALGFSVAVLLRSQVAGVVAGIALYIGESIFTAILVVITLGGRGLGESAERGVSLGTQWFQFLPFSIGNSVLAGAPGASDELGRLLDPLPLAVAIVATATYLIGSLLVAMFVTSRTEISG